MNKEFNRPEPIIEVGQVFKVQFTDLTHTGQGIAKISGKNLKGVEYFNFPVFVPLAAIGDQGIIELTQIKKDYALGKFVKLFPDKKSPDHVPIKCKHYPDCGGCNIMHLSYQAQCDFKTKMVKRTLERIGKLTDVEVKPIIGMDNPWYYRNKVQVPFGERRGKTIGGFYRLNSHEVIPLEECHIQSEEMTEIIKFTKNLLNEFKIKGYDEQKHQGEIRHVLIRESRKTSEIMVVLVCLNDIKEKLTGLVGKLIKRHPRIVSIYLNINKDRTNEILGDETILLHGKEAIVDELLGIKFNISPKSFFQVNPEQTERLYSQVLELGDFSKDDIVIDAYCGIGTISLAIAPHVKHVFGVEVVEDAIKDAKKNALQNEISNATFVCNEAEKQLELWQQSGIKAQAIVVDPPRKGCDKRLLQTIVEMRIPKMIYVSCDPATLARDLRFLIDQGYTVDTVQPVDMFPQTYHVETVVLMSRAKE